MCCLKYEHEVYAELQKQTPKIESLVETPAGRGTVVSTQMLRGVCQVLLEDGDDTPQQFHCSECVVLRSGKAKGRPAPPPEKTEKAEEEPRPARRGKPPRERQEGARAEVPEAPEEAGKTHRRRRRRRTEE